MAKEERVWACALLDLARLVRLGCWVSMASTFLAVNKFNPGRHFLVMVMLNQFGPVPEQHPEEGKVAHLLAGSGGWTTGTAVGVHLHPVC